MKRIAFFLWVLIWKRLVLILSFLIWSVISYSQTLTQTIRGQVVDQQTGISIPGATIVLMDSDPIIGTTTDMDGFFQLDNVPVGRQTLQVTFIGYDPIVARDILINSGKETVLNLEMVEAVTQLKEAVVKAERNPEKPLNEMATVSARTFSVDEATRFAGALNDPARMAANYAGVTTSGDLRNDIVVRGNSPANVQYRIDDIEVPNPNHFGTYGASGGAVSMISQNALANSDFLTGAFPGMYGNVLGGVFDINLRSGNSQEHEYTGLFSFRGLELTAEGPLAIGKNASFLVNYRYSTLEIFDAFGLNIGVPAVPRYQDLTFKLDMPTGGKLGRFSLYGIGGVANIDLLDSDAEDPEDFFSQDQPSDIHSETQMGVVGLTNTHFWGKRTTGRVFTSLSASGDIFHQDTLSAPNYSEAFRNSEGRYTELRYSAGYTLKHKFNARHFVKAGARANIRQLDFTEKERMNGVFRTINDFEGNATIARAFAEYQYRLTQSLTLNSGLHYMHFDLTSSNVVEPRAGLKWQLNNLQAINVGFGMHSQILPLNAYFATDENDAGNLAFKNRNVDLMRSLHYVVGYERSLAPSWQMRVEAYYQDLYDIPVEQESSSFSAINTGNDFEGFPDDVGVLENSGTGSNYGVELTLEKFLSNGYYTLLTTSFFESRYTGSDGVERSTAFNQNYVVNALAGKEWKVGKSKDNVLGLNLRLNLMGGRRYTPIDREASQQQQQVVALDDRAFEKQYDPYVRADMKVSYTINRKKVSHQLAIDIQNLTNNQNIFQDIYNVSTNEITTEYQQGFLPDIQYRIYF